MDLFYETSEQKDVHPCDKTGLLQRAEDTRHELSLYLSELLFNHLPVGGARHASIVRIICEYNE